MLLDLTVTSDTHERPTSPAASSTTVSGRARPISSSFTDRLAGPLDESRIVNSNGEPVEVDYVMRQSGESWLIADIYLDSAISEVATPRSEFAAILLDYAYTMVHKAPQRTSKPHEVLAPVPA